MAPVAPFVARRSRNEVPMSAFSNFSTLQLSAAAVIATAVLPVAEFRVQVDKENIVSNSIEGTWVSDDPLNAKLGSGAKAVRLEITRDDSIATKIPAKYEPFLGKKQIYAAGTVLWKEGDRQPMRMPMVVVEYSGNPHIVTFRPLENDPFGDGESGNVMLVRAHDPANDLLFLGGDTARETFQAFHREAPLPK
jgi:hypothetical protein